jgi:hypothetical protein
MNCPICGAEAQDITVQTFDGKTIRCPNCNDYDISGTVYDADMLQKLDPERRRAALERARRAVQVGKRPIIKSSDL